MEEGIKDKWYTIEIKFEVLDEVSESKIIRKAPERMRVKLISHLLRHNEFPTNIIEGKVLDKRERGRTMKPYFDDMQQLI